MDTLREVIKRYGTENDHQEYWDRLAQNYSDQQVIQGILASFLTDNADVLWRTCTFVQHATAHFPTVIRQPEIIQTIEDIAAGNNLRNAHTAVFLLGRIGSKRSIERLRYILSNCKHNDSDFIRELETTINMLSR